VPTYQWQLLTNALPSALSLKDGIGGAFLNGKLYAMGGWAQGGARFNSVSYSTNGITWTPSAQPASWTGRHAMPVVVHNGRIFVLGGDQNSGAYQPDVHSWSGEETEPWVVEDTNAPWGQRAGHYAWSDGDYIHVECGQTVTNITPAPTTFFTDHWRSLTGQSGTWELVESKVVSGWRGYLSNSPPVIDGEAFIVGGGTYDTTDFLGREYKNDVFAQGPTRRLVTHGKGSLLSRLMYHNIGVLNGALVVMAGWNNANQNRVFVSPDKGLTWNELPLPPWSARHAALLISAPDAIYFGTGMSVSDMWKLTELPPPNPKVHLGAPVDGTTGFPAVYTVLDKSTALVAGVAVVGIGLSCSRSQTLIPKIAKQVSANTFDIVWSGTAVTHPGGGHASFPIPSFTPPSDGYTYRIGVAMQYTGGADSYAHAGIGRFMKLGDIFGAGQVFSTPTDGSLSMSWTEA
jgi:hypothetical protein